MLFFSQIILMADIFILRSIYLCLHFFWIFLFYTLCGRLFVLYLKPRNKKFFGIQISYFFEFLQKEKDIFCQFSLLQKRFFSCVFIWYGSYKHENFKNHSLAPEFGKKLQNSSLAPRQRTDNAWSNCGFNCT